MRISVRVQPGASARVVGGRWGDSEPPVLLVRVPERAVEGRANDAVTAALAEAFGVHHRSVAVVTGRTSRSKHVDVDGDEPRLRERLIELLGRSGST